MAGGREKAWISWSSGKDSAWALEVARRDERLEIVGLLATVTEPFGRVSMHGVREELLEAQADSVGLPLHRVPLPFPCPNEAYERAMRSALERTKSQGVTTLVFGDIFLADVRAYRERQLSRAGFRASFPLWGLETRRLAREMVAAGLRARLTCVDPKVLPRRLAGEMFDSAFLALLPPTVDPCGENGEFHTFAYAGPMFQHAIGISVGSTVEREGFVFADLRLVSSQPATGGLRAGPGPADGQDKTQGR